MSDGLLYVLMVLAAYRVWRLLGFDSVTESARDAALGNGWVRRLVVCPWCLGSWVAFAAVAGVWAIRPLPLPALWFAAVAAGVGIVAEVLERLEPGDW